MTTQRLIEVIEKLNHAIDRVIGFENGEQCHEASTLYLTLTSTGWMDSVSFLGAAIWDSESEAEYDENDDVVDVEQVLKQRMVERMAGIRKLEALDRLESIDRILAGH